MSSRALIDAAVAAALSFVVLGAVFWPLERLFPARAGQGWRTRVLSVDTIYFVGQYLFWTSVAVGLLALAAPLLSRALPSAVRAAFGAQPIALQLVEGVFLADLSCYGFHRACHRFDFLWSFHAVHHSAPEVDWLAAHREHPLDGILTHAALNVPLLLLGVPLHFLAGLVAFRGLWAIFVHSNVKLSLGPLLYLFGAPQLHRWHHARDGMGRHNFANLAPYLDLLFGTFHRPADAESWDVGLAQPFPQGYVGQLMSPFTSMKPALIACALLFVACGELPMTPTDAGHDAGQDAGATGPRLSGLPDCGTPADGGTIDDVFNNVAMIYGCMAGGCHAGSPFFLFQFNDAATLKAAWVNVKSSQVPTMNRITPGDINQSYVIYKMWGQHLDAGVDGSGDRMPQGGPYVPDRDLCTVINWVNAGAH